ncbi:6,7-dimethyl-8-ribityllumazine synthase [Nocardia crassostreae]|uniref:6,7-dimethyl-8-ribityllumazine synthase n=1 Tax=Nocardia crassostreae TaxID=53428 RepID=UPI000833A35B|nr:6,7-dimethyl-8-ribityllumazine synthase [Nocardia crassostreae]
MSPNRIVIIAARWHAEIVDEAVRACRIALADRGYPDVDVVEVPGAFEIPLRAKRLAASGEYAAIAACALVVDGGIYRHDFVAATVVDALMRVQLDTDVPVFSAVLTPHHFHEHEEHLTYFGRHFAVKGTQLANAIVETLGLDVTV